MEQAAAFTSLSENGSKYNAVMSARDRIMCREFNKDNSASVYA